jgi:hypothetical protein
MGSLTNDAFGRVDHIATYCWHPTATSVINHRALLLGGCLSIKVLLADDSDVMRRAIAKLLNEEPSTSPAHGARSTGGRGSPGTKDC